MKKILGLAVVLTLLGQPAFAQSESKSTEAYKESMMHMHHGMDIPYTGDADIDFAKGMIPHHRGAIDMAKVVLKYGKDPELKNLATEVIQAQEKEIDFLNKWLEKHAKK